MGSKSNKQTSSVVNSSNQTLGADNGAVVAEDSSINFNSLDGGAIDKSFEFSEEAVERSLDFAADSFERSGGLASYAVKVLSEAQARDAGRAERSEQNAITAASSALDKVSSAFSDATNPESQVTKYTIVAVAVVALSLGAMVVFKGGK